MTRFRMHDTTQIFAASLLIALSSLAFSATSAQAQSPVSAQIGQPVQPAPADPAISKALQQVSAAQVQATIEKLVSFNNRNTLSSMDKDLPPGQGVTAAADWIYSQFEAYSKACGGCLEVKRDTFTNPVAPRVPQPTTLTNVYAILRGSDPAQAKRMYLVTGHYDSRNSDTFNTRDPAPGANDDASGVAVSMESARVLSKMKFPATLVFVAVAGEEQGLDGSHHLAELARSEGWDLQGVLNNDIVGGNTTPGDTLQDKTAVRVFSEGVPRVTTPQQLQILRGFGGENDSPSRELARAMVDASRTYSTGFHPVLIFRQDRFGRGGDHSSFNQQGFAAVRVTEWREDYNHQHQDVRKVNGVQYGDMLQFVDFNYVAHVTKANAATLAVLASAPPAPKNVRLDIQAQENVSKLSWEPGDGSPVGTQFEVVWRDTSAPDWQRMYDAKAATNVTLPMSKDNVIFGLRAVDAAGHRSLVATPLPYSPHPSFSLDQTKTATAPAK
ncbi:MAG: M28 family metallopeptidase [Acidobacteriaceae bacterium]